MLVCASLSLGSACAFESGGVPGSGGAGASVGSASSGTGEGTDTEGNASAGMGASAGSTAGDDVPDPSTDDSPGNGDDSTGPVVSESTGGGTTSSLDPTGEATGTTGVQETGAASSEGGVVEDPYYGDCTHDGDCGSGTCVTVNVIDGPDASVCLLPCGEGCPPPSSGEATPVCTMSDSCALACGPEIECPTGMDCYTFESAQGDYYRCLWEQQA